MKLSFLLIHTSPLTARQQETRLWFWHDHGEKLSSRQYYSWIVRNGAVCCLAVGWDFSRRQLHSYSVLHSTAPWQLLHDEKWFSPLQKLSCRWEGVSMENQILLSLTTQCLRFCFHFIDFWWLTEGKHDPLVQALKGNPDLSSAPCSDTDFLDDTGQVT